MKVLGLFDGISCGRVSLDRLGIEVSKYDAYEINEDAIKVALYNYPTINQKGDVFKAIYKKGEYDLLLGGSPCTYWSIAQSKDKREVVNSGMGWELFMQYVRALQEVQPKYFLYENNFSMTDIIKDEITKQLGVEPIMIDSADFSAQSRKRYYWTNIPVSLDYEKSELVIDDILYPHDFRVRDFTKYKDTVKWNKDKTVCKYDSSGKGYYSQASRCRKTSIKSNTLTASGNDKNNVFVEDFKCRTLHPIEAERLQTLPDNYTSCINSKVKRSELCGNGWTVDVICHILRGIKGE